MLLGIGDYMMQTVTKESPLLEALLESSAEGILFLNSSTKIINLSTSMMKYFKKSKDILLGKEYIELLKSKNSPITRSVQDYMKQPNHAVPYSTIEDGVYIQIIELKYRKNTSVWLVIYDFSNSSANLLEFLEKIALVMPGNFYWKDKNSYYLGCNPALLEALNFTSENFIGKTDVDLWPNQANEIRKHDKRVMETGKLIRLREEVELQGVGKRYYTVIKVPLRDKYGNIIGIISNSLDITDQIELHKKIALEKKKADKFNTLKDQFIQNMEHDIRTPATGIQQALEYFVKYATTPDMKKVAEMAMGASEEFNKLMDDIVNFDQVQYQHALVEKPLILSDIFNSIYRLNSTAALPKQLKLHFKIDASIPRILLSDEFYLRHILLNLVGNAIKFTNKGEVFFQAVLIKTEDRKALIEFSVADTGKGIPKDKQDVIFERFVRLEPSNKGLHKGSGLGLSVVRDYVNRLGGEIRPIHSELNKGTTISVLIPMQISLDQSMKRADQKNVKAEAVVEPTQEKPSPPPPTPDTLETDTKKPDEISVSEATLEHTKADVLLVEDSVLAQHLAQSILQDLHCEVTVAGSAENALELLKTNDYDLIFADIGLPKMNGIDMVREIRYQEKKEGKKMTPIVGQTAQADTENKRKSIEAGMQDVLPKPLSETVVSEVLVQYVPRYAETHPTPPKAVERQVQHPSSIDLEFLEDICPDIKKRKVLFRFAKLQIEIWRQDITQEYLENDWEGLEYVVHKVRGGCISIAAMRVEEACAHLEEYLKEHPEPDEMDVTILYDIIMKEIKALAQEAVNLKF